MKTDITRLKKGDILSEESHYVVIDVGEDTKYVTLRHVETGDSVNLSKTYVKSILCSGDQYDKVVEVTKEDKKDGTPGIRSIFESIRSSEVFTVVFKKQDKDKTKKKIKEEMEAQRAYAIELIDKAKRQKKSMATAYKIALEYVQNNPIKDYEEGELRTLRGFKLQHISRDGKYRCLDMDIERTDKETGERLVNINTIQELIYNRVKYVVE